MGWFESVSIPYLLRHAGGTYASGMREALDEAGYDDIPKNGLYVIGALARDETNVLLAKIIDDLKLSKQAAGQLVDTLVTRGYLDRRTDPCDRRRLIVSLSERGRDAARIQTEAGKHIDSMLRERTSSSDVSILRQMLAALIEMRQTVEKPRQRCVKKPMIRDVVPILLVSDVSRSAAFYSEKLGFATDFLYGDPPYYGSVSRDGACLHLRYLVQPNFPERSAREDALIVASFEISDVYALYAEFESRDVPIARGLIKQVWGGTDFHVCDPDGNEISFVQYTVAETPKELD